MTVAAENGLLQKGENLDDLLAVEMSNQSVLQVVDRGKIQAVLKEHAIALSNAGNTQNAVAMGKFVGADYLLHVLPAKKTATIRLVEVAGGQVKLEDSVALRDDLSLSAVAIREKVLAALRPESQAANRLTVGIAAFPNRSGTDRSDKIGVELQKALRKRLQDRPWAVVLERQYPTALLDEVDLARTGLVRDKAVEKLPPADLVILGTLEDVGGEYEPGKPWEVRIELTLRSGGDSGKIGRKFRSDAVDAAADEVFQKIDEFRRGKPASQTVVPEKELWRRQALYLMPTRCETWCQAIVPNFHVSSESRKQETFRAWENVLLFDCNDPEAMTYLGVCLIGFNRWSSRSDAAVAQSIAGSRLVERAMRSHPSDVRADTFISCLGPLKDMAPARAKEMVQYILDHPELFKHRNMYWVKAVQNMPASEAGGDPTALHAGWNRALQNAEKDPESVLLAFSRAPGAKTYPLEQAADFLTRHIDSPDPVVQFVAHRNVAELRCRQNKDAAGLEHYDKAIEVLEKANAKCNGRHYVFLDNIYQLRIEACQLLGRPEEARQTALAGTRHFLATGRFNPSIAWLYCFCVTEVFGNGQEKEALAVCESYLAAMKRDPMTRPYSSPRLYAKREELMARLAGRPVPGLGGLRLAKGTLQPENPLPMLRMAATGRQIWLVIGGRTGGAALVYSADLDETRRPPVELGACLSVAATKDAVYYGGSGGLCKLGTDGKRLKSFRRDDGALPSNVIYDVREGGGKIYLSFHGGVAMLDPATDKVSVLAPSSRDANRKAEPVGGAIRLRWDAVTPNLYACYYPHWYFAFPELGREFVWSPRDNAWRLCPAAEAPQLVASQGDEAVAVRFSGEQSEFHFLKTGQKVVAAVPAPQLMGEPAWDEHRIWVPSAGGLYEVDRATGRVTWLARQDGNPFLSILKHDGRLYIGATRGLYYREIPPPASTLSE